MTRRILLVALTLVISMSSALLAGASDVPVAWQVVDDGWPNSYTQTYYDDEFSRVRGVETSAEGSPPRIWELDGEDTWRRVFVDDGAAPLEETRCVGYDAQRRALVHVDRFGNTHELAGGVWSMVATPTGAPASVRCTMAFDVSRGVMVALFVATYEPASPNATWEYDGTAWTLVSPIVAPPAGMNPALTYDAGLGKVTLYGEPFDASKPPFQAYVWRYDGTTWTRIVPLGIATPGRRGRHVWVHDPSRGKTLLYSGIQDTSTVPDLWEWDGQRWTRLEEVTPLGARTFTQGVYDSTRSRVVFYGGRGIPAREGLVIWTYAAGAWQEIGAWEGPIGFSGYGMAVMPDPPRVLVMGGVTADRDGIDETWIWQGGGWQREAVDAPPSAWYSAPLAYDEVEGKVVGFGGTRYPDFTPVGDTHRLGEPAMEWTSTSSPELRARLNAGLAFSKDLGSTLMLGGSMNDELGFGTDDRLWELREGTWREVPASGDLPGPRQHCPLAADTIRGGVWAYGGSNGLFNGPAHLWHFDGAVWTLVSADAPPGERASHGLAHDPTRDRLVVYGYGPPTEAVTWEWGQGAWHGRTTVMKPEPEREGCSLAYDAEREVVFLFGGRPWDGLERYDLWAYGADPDEDGIVGRLDNCRDIGNAEQANADGDPLGDACDCAPGDAALWLAPPEVVEVAFDATGVSLTWGTLADVAGPATVYDALRGSVDALPLEPSAAASCIASGLTTPSLIDEETPPAGNAWWYLVRGRNACGVGSFGAASGGQERTHGGCD